MSALARLRGRLVLIVEDDVDAQLITTATLRHFGYDVVKADSLKSALRLTETLRPNAVVLDCRLPDGDGLSLARQWREDSRMKDVPVIVLTAGSARQDVEAALLAGADAFFVKPVPGAVLAMQIDKLLSGTRPSQRLRAQRS